MPHLNVELPEDVIALAKESAARVGMLLRAWIAHAIQEAATAQRAPVPPKDAKPERTYAPLEDV